MIRVTIEVDHPATIRIEEERPTSYASTAGQAADQIKAAADRAVARARAAVQA